MTKQTRSIEGFAAGLKTAKSQPARIPEAFDRLIDDCKSRMAQPIGDDARPHVAAQIELAAAEKALATFNEWPIEGRQTAAAGDYLRANVTEICATLRSDIAERSKPQSGFIAEKLKLASGITLNLFAGKTDRNAIYKEREAAEQAASDAEYIVSAAASAVRGFELMPTEAAFSEAAARVAEINFPSVV